MNQVRPNKDAQSLRILYKNWRGETAERRVLPISIWFGGTDWHPDKQWLMKAVDLDKNTERDFALKNIIKWLNSSS